MARTLLLDTKSKDTSDWPKLIATDSGNGAHILPI